MDRSGLNGFSSLLHRGMEEREDDAAGRGSRRDSSPGSAAGGEPAGNGPVDGWKVNKAAPSDGSPDDPVWGEEESLPRRLEDRCVISDDQGPLNGFRTPGERRGFGGEGGGGRAVPGSPFVEGGESGGLLFPGRVSGTRPALRKDCGGTQCGELLDSDAGQLQINGVPTAGGLLSVTGGGDRGADTTPWCHVEEGRPDSREPRTLSNGGFDVFCTPRDLHELLSPEEKEKQLGCPQRGSDVRTSCVEQGHNHDPGGPGVLDPRTTGVQDPTAPGPGRPLLPASCPITPSDPPSPGTGPPSPPGTGPPARPRTLRTRGAPTGSLSCGTTPLSPEDGALYWDPGRRQSAPDPHLDPHLDPPGSSSLNTQPKRWTFTEFFSRSLFSRSLFGRAAPEREAPPPGRRRGGNQLDFEPQSTTALILEDRPGDLPAKSEEEARRHKQEYEEMVAGARRREVKEAERRRRRLKERLRQEESISHAISTWTNQILPHWEDMRSSRRTRELWWSGLPPSVRGRVWSLAIGNDLNITPELYDIFLCRVKERSRCSSETSSVNDNESDGGASLADRESSLDLIKLDISRTFPSLFIFQKGGPYHDVLHSILGAYTCYRPDIGYVQGMSFMAAVLLLNQEEAQAFITFTNLLNKPCLLAFFRVDHQQMLKYFAAFEVFFEENLPRLFRHFLANSLTPDLYLIDWIFTLYSKALPLDVACRVWDVFCRDGEESLFRTALGLLRLYQDLLLHMDLIHMGQFLTRLPPDLPPHRLFSAMAHTHMVSSLGRWPQVFSSLMKDGNKETDKSGSPALRS